MSQAQIIGGKLLGQVRQQLVAATKPGVTFESIDQLAHDLLLKTGGQPSFETVPGYHWATCINVNDGIVHGIPKGTFKSGDLATIDVGLLYQGLHTDTSTSFVVGQTTKTLEHFLQVGRQTLAEAIAQAIPGNHVWDISFAIQSGIQAAGFSVVRNLTGHGVGKELHEDPAIPCYTSSPKDRSPKLHKGQVIAVEVMYCQGSWHTITDSDGWTIRTKDGKLSAVYEETIMVDTVPKVLTKSS